MSLSSYDKSHTEQMKRNKEMKIFHSIKIPFINIIQVQLKDFKVCYLVFLILDKKLQILFSVRNIKESIKSNNDLSYGIKQLILVTFLFLFAIL